MPFTTGYKRGDVVLVPFPFTDLSSAKQRPALIVSADAFNAVRDDVLVAAITSQIPGKLAIDEFMIPPSELAACGLPKPSIIRLTKLAALHQRLIIKSIGSLPTATLGQVIAQLRQLF
ncbi:MAG: type II toxin-antitoxin system PemK/MazF family toxin [Verrucomicrobia subdivision 3 bacterium]|nr:type II toxin-antitoxin system PemK/MazF family toxin [Limisphaerales bacterium]